MTGDSRAVTALTVPQPEAPDKTTYELMMAQAKHAVQSGLLPNSVDTPAKALVIIRKGRELGVPDMYALSHINVIEGKPAVSAEMILALVYRSMGGNALRVVKTSREKCVVRARRPEWDDPMEIEYTIEDAKQAGLTGNPRSAWAKYPAHMLRWRAISTAAKLAFPDVLGGLYTAEELGADVRIDPSGEIWIEEVAAEPEGRFDTQDLEMMAAPEAESDIIDAETSTVDAPQPPTEQQIRSIGKLAELLERSQIPVIETFQQAASLIQQWNSEYSERRKVARVG